MKQPRSSDEMLELSKPLFQTRDYCGYFQSLQTHIDRRGKEIYVWRFKITRLINENEGMILKWDNSEEPISIGEWGMILINKWTYIGFFWSH